MKKKFILNLWFLLLRYAKTQGDYETQILTLRWHVVHTTLTVVESRVSKQSHIRFHEAIKKKIFLTSEPSALLIINTSHTRQSENKENNGVALATRLPRILWRKRFADFNLRQALDTSLAMHGSRAEGRGRRQSRPQKWSGASVASRRLLSLRWT